MSGHTKKNIDISDGGFAKRIENLRRARGMTKFDLAEKAGLSGRGIHNIESGKQDRVLEKTVYLLADTLRVSYDELVHGSTAHASSTTSVSWIRRPVIFLGIIAAIVIIVVIAVVGEKNGKPLEIPPPIVTTKSEEA